MDKYKKELSAWEKEKYRQKYEFCVTESDLDADKRLTDDVEIVVSLIKITTSIDFRYSKTRL
jgi:hypothetical protein